MQIQPLHRTHRAHQDRQPQLCVPPMGIDGPSYRLRSHQVHAAELGKAVGS